MTRRTKLITLIVSVLTLSASASAQAPAPDSPRLSARGEDRGEEAEKSPAARNNQSSTARGGRGGWVVSAYLGGARTGASALRISQPALGNDLTFERVRFRSRSFDPPLYYGLRGGYFPPRVPFLGFEAEFIHL